MDIEEILIVQNDKVRFGIPTQSISQILRIPQLAPIALSPDEVRGICVVAGNIVNAIDLNVVFGMEKVDEKSFKGRILSFRQPFESFALMVSEVFIPIVVDPEQLEMIDNASDPIIAVVHYGEELIHVLDIEQLARKNYFEPTLSASPLQEKIKQNRIAESVSLPMERYTIFRMGNEIFALRIDHLSEILNYDQNLTPLAGSNPEIMGMLSLRGSFLVVADLRLYCGFESRSDSKNKILVIQSRGKKIGLLVDEIIDIKEYELGSVVIFDQIDETERISGVIHEGDAIISLVGESLINEIVVRNEEILIQEDENHTLAEKSAVMEAVIFRLGEGEYALSIDDIAEIIDAVPITPIAFAPERLEGMINIRGQIVAIGSLYQLLGLEPSVNQNQKIIICHTPSGRTGFFIDALCDVLQVQSDELLDIVEEGSMFSKVLHLENGNRLVLVLNIESLKDMEVVG